MSEDTGATRDTGTSYTASEAVTTKSYTETIGRPPRRFYFVIQVLAFSITLVLCLWSQRFRPSFEEMGLKDLPIPAELILALGKVLSKPVGMAAAGGICIGLGLLAIRGVLDGFLKMLIWLNVLWVLVFVVMAVWNIFIPIIRSAPALPK